MASGTFPITPGTIGYYLGITLAAGTSQTAAANDVWAAASAPGAVGQSNFAASPVNSTFDLAFVQHCPGTNVDPIDKSWSQNYDECLRFYAKSYPYPTLPGATNQSSFATFQCPTAVSGAAYTIYGGTRFPKQMAKQPTCMPYHNVSGASSAVNGWYATSGTIPTTNGALSATGVNATASGITSLNMASGTSTAQIIGYAEWTADTAW